MRVTNYLMLNTILKLMKRYIWQPIAFLLVGLGFYINNGVKWNAWMDYLPHIIGYAVICAALCWALYKKEQYKTK